MIPSPKCSKGEGAIPAIIIYDLLAFQFPFILGGYSVCMEKEAILTDTKFNLVMAVAIVALVIGTAGLIVGMMKPSPTPPNILQPNANGGSSVDGMSNDKNFQVNPDGPINEATPRRSGSMEQPAH